MCSGVLKMSAESSRGFAAQTPAAIGSIENRRGSIAKDAVEYANRRTWAAAASSSHAVRKNITSGSRSRCSDHTSFISPPRRDPSTGIPDHAPHNAYTKPSRRLFTQCCRLRQLPVHLHGRMQHVRISHHYLGLVHY